ncbi:MAG TPA: hypothetical protein CFH81_04430 [Sulfurovum sp. UBA12169]|nr:MAG TPA: hypothetical protein CFH81_04430 [Sulfurovum sp. UBA12169]
MSNFKSYLFAFLAIGFIAIAISAYFESQPEQKNKRIYKEIKKYSPYYIDKRFGGLQILSKTDKDFKEKPSNVEIFRQLDTLEKKWGKSHLKIENSQLHILDDKNVSIAAILLQNQEELLFIQQFYGIEQ